jgi:DNA-directed RNA polymerase subunit RPC12/RpoP
MIPTSSGIWDDLCSLFGRVRFRCISCRNKQVHQLWAFADNRYAHCPNCFSPNLQRWSPAFLPRSVRRSLVRMIGGHCYRCVDCSHAFTSLRSAKSPLRSVYEVNSNPEPEAVAASVHAATPTDSPGDNAVVGNKPPA